VSTLYNEWERVFGIVYGEEMGQIQDDREAFGSIYNVDEPEVRPLLFSVHTYYALLMKMLSTELLATTSETPIDESSLHEVDPDELREILREMEAGKQYELAGLQDFFEEGFFGWYLDVWSEEVAEIMQRRQETIVTEIDRLRGGPEEYVGGVAVIKHTATVLDRCRTMLSEAEEWAFLTAPPDLVERLAEDLEGARERGVVVMVFTKDLSEPSGRPLEQIASVVRVREDFELFHQFALAVDYFRSLVGTPDAMDHHAVERLGPALYVEGEYVTPRINASFLEYEWKLGVERVVPEPA
jgi:hypothetical protein